MPFSSVSLDQSGRADVGVATSDILKSVFDLPVGPVSRMGAGAKDPFQVRGDQPGKEFARSFVGAMSPVGLNPTGEMTVVRLQGPSPSDLDWLDAGEFWSASIPDGVDPRAVLDLDLHDEYGRPLPIAMASSPIAGHWSFEKGSRKISVCKTKLGSVGAASARLDIVYCQPSISPMRVQGGEAYFENILFLGVMPWVVNAWGKVAKAVFKNCAFWYSPGPGVGNEGGYAVLDGCEIYRCRDDGVGSHRSQGSEARHIGINTVVRYAGDVDTYGTAGENQNGFSMHESGLAAIIGCDIRKSCGPNLIDTGSGPGSTGVSWWCGVHCQESLGKNPANFASYGARTIYMERCSEGASDHVAVQLAGEGTVLHYHRNNVSEYVTENGAMALPMA